jgi:hypothetical protein
MAQYQPIPTSFHEWYETKPYYFMERIEAGEAGNKNNPIIAAKYAFEAGIQAGLELASQHLASVLRHEVNR